MKHYFLQKNYTDLKCLSCDKTALKIKTKVISNFAVAAFAVLGICFGTIMANQASAVVVNTPFQVNVVESLSVSVTTPSTWANGYSGEFLRDEVDVSVNTNNAGGFTASMYSASTNAASTKTSLAKTSDSTKTIPTLASSSTRSAFPVNYWGYSLGAYTLNGVTQSSYTLNSKTYNETQAGNNSSNYHPMVSNSASPIIIMDGSTTAKTSGTQEVYFGTKANNSTVAGTYVNTVIISVVTGVIDNNNPVTPSNPVVPGDDTANDNQPTYVTRSNINNTVYTTTSTTATTGTTTVQIHSGDVTSSYPLGVTENTISNIYDKSSLANGLALTASVAAASGFFFFILAKRREDDEDEELEQHLS